MLALVAAGHALKAMLAEVPEPDPARDEAVVEVRATSLNRGEVRRLLDAPAGARPGWDIAGVVVRAAANGRGPKEGTRVVGLLPGGAWAQRVAVPVDMLAELPESISFAAAATLPVAGLTALKALQLGGMLLERRVLITGAAGGVGRFAIQLAAQSGAHVTGIVSRPERARGLRELGADEIVIGDFPADRAWDLILESVGGASLAAALTSVAPGGLVVSFGNSSREPVTFDASGFYMRPGARVYGFLLFTELQREGSGPRDLRLLADLVARGRLDPQIVFEESWRNADRAFAALMERQVDGKAVLIFD
jgi:NADPH2:quinone reductase